MQKKTKLLLTLLGLAIALLGLAGAIATSYARQQAREAALQELPPLPFIRTDGTAFRRDHLRPGHPTVIIAFRPDCEYCADEMAQIQAKLEALAGTDLLLIGRTTAEETAGFSRHYPWLKSPNIHLLADPDEDFPRLFGTEQVPAVFIYDRAGHLSARYTGWTRIEAILQNI